MEPLMDHDVSREHPDPAVKRAWQCDLIKGLPGATSHGRP